MNHIKLWPIRVCFAITLHCLASSVAQDVAECSPRCWNPVQQNAGVLGAIKLQGVVDQEQCKALCVNNGTCIGVDWNRTDSGCWFQLTALTSYAAKDVNHWSLTYCTDECASYCWKAVIVDFHVFTGTLQNATDENHCKLLCSGTPTCKGVDWVPTYSQCWLIIDETRRENISGIRHWDIIRNLPTHCQTSSTEYFTYTSPEMLTGKVTSSNYTTNTLKPACEYSKESTTGLKTATIVLAVLLGLCMLIIIGLVLNTIKHGRTMITKSNAENTEMGMDNTYDGLQRVVRSPDPVYTDLVQANSNNGLETNK